MNRALVRILVVCAALGVAANSVSADDLARGLQAYDGGDFSGAVAAWRRAAADGDTEAMNALANAYQRGHGVRPDPETAVSWYRRAADRGNAVAQMNLGDLASRGEGMKRDFAEAFVWLSLAARQGNQWAHDRRDRVAAALTSDERARADARIRAFKPSPAPGGR